MHASNLEPSCEKLSEANQREQDLHEQANKMKHLLNARQVEIDGLVDELDLATRDHKESLSDMASAHRLNIEIMKVAHDDKINKLEQRTFELSSVYLLSVGKPCKGCNRLRRVHRKGSTTNLH